MFRRKRDDRDFSAEIEAHLEFEADHLREQGLSADEARAAAHRSFGNVLQARERFYESGRWMWWDNFSRDVRYALRMLRKSPVFTAVAVATLALTIGANAVVFGVLNGLILRPLDLPHAESLYQIAHSGDDSANQAYPNYLDLRDRNRTFDGIAAYSITAAGLNSGENPARVWVVQASGNYFDVLEIQPLLGRFFHVSDENGSNSAPYAVLSYAYWQNHFQGDPKVVGQTVLLNRHPFTILGVAPSGFYGTILFFRPDFFVPIVNQPQLEGNDLNARGKRWVFELVGHLKAGVTPAQAVADLNAIGAGIEKTYPETAGQMTFRLARPGLYGDFLGRPVRAFVAGLMLLAALILLAACANLGTLFAARATDRFREVALRLALGASRLSVLRQMLTEALLLSLAGGAAGLLGSVWLLRVLSAWNPLPRFPMRLAVVPDSGVYVAALLLALLSGLLFGLVPIRQIQRTDPYQIIKAGTTGAVRGRFSLRDLLLSFQIAVCALLVTSSLVAVRGLMHSMQSDFGFEPQNALLIETDLKMAGYTGAQVPEMQKRMIGTLQELPGVSSVGLVDWPPLDQGFKAALVFADQTADLRPSNAAATAMLLKISPEYFQAARTPMVTGRTFTWHDDQGAPPVAVVNQEFARKVIGTPDAVGRYFKVLSGERIQVVGIVKDGKYMSLTESPHAAMFRPILQAPSSLSFFVVRSERGPELAADARATLRGVDAGLPVFIQTWYEDLNGVLFPSRVATASLGVLGALGALLSVTGIFGMAAYSVSRRLKELGIRIALGAQTREVLHAALGKAFKLLAFGSVAGLVLGILASRVLESIVYQATTRDPLVLAGVVFSMALLGLLATWIPAQRALAIDPLALLREE